MSIEILDALDMGVHAESLRYARRILLPPLPLSAQRLARAYELVRAVCRWAPIGHEIELDTVLLCFLGISRIICALHLLLQ